MVRSRTREQESRKEIAHQVVLLVEGATSLILIHGDRRYANAVAGAAKTLVNAQRPRDDPGNR